MSNTLYNHTSGVPVQQTRGVSSTIRSEFDLVQAGFDKAIDKTGDTVTGQIEFPTPTLGTSPATKAYADGLAFATVLPAQTGNAGKFVTTDGVTASWAEFRIPDFLLQTQGII